VYFYVIILDYTNLNSWNFFTKLVKRLEIDIKQF